PDSADVVANPELFRLDRQRRPSIVTGVPPDLFSKNGQLWGHPHYRWSAHRRDGFRWWRERVRAALDRFDSLRIDHFVGFVHAFEIPAAHRTAKHGRWRPTPGRELLAALRREFGELPFIAEDLGAVTAEVVRLRDEFGLPGMRLLQNAFGGGDSLDLPHRHPEHCVVYPGTHDNDTIAGWWRTLDAASRRRALDYAGGSSREIVSSLLRLALTSPANLCVIPMQDLLALGSQARMNKPWQSRGQWEWRLPANWLTRIDAAAWKRRIDAARRSPRHA
ncbi:MAG: 4-alpha-glucanotransferase, partial [Phycisphaerae bacterium]|nr:4-alpha-glucanotransferase [Phycisphaerae bacterium]